MKNQQQYISVLLPLPLKGVFDYKPITTENMPLVGSFVRVPFGKKNLNGIVVECHDRSLDLAPERIKTILSVLEVPPLTSEIIAFIKWMAHYTLNAEGNILKLFMSVPGVFDAPKMKTYYKLKALQYDQAIPKLTPLQQKIVDVVQCEDGMTREQIEEQLRFSPSVLKTLVDKGVLLSEERVLKEDINSYTYQYHAPLLSEDQHAVAQVLIKRVDDGGYSVSVIDGVTGSGKTEVYFEAIAKALKNEGQVVVLLPEIVLSPQWLERFEQRFGEKPLVWHSDIKERKRRKAWLDIAKGDARIVVGARSALFLPYPNLKLIVVDEEHDASYKQEEGVIYQGRDMAVLRAHLAKIPIILASATPSLETIENCNRGRYQSYVLKNRHGAAVMPKVSLIPLHSPQEKGKKQYWISDRLAELIRETTDRHEQVLLYLNRRGYAPVTLCRDCGKKIECPRCSVPLVEHRIHEDLRCHHCGYSQSFHTECLSCGAEESFVSCGPGVERIAEEVKVRFPSLRSLVVASDHVQAKQGLSGFLDQIHNQEVDVIIGTQIMAKGHHFPSLTLVGVIDADLGLSGADMRASERTFQTLHQVSGRAGRASKPGHVYIQTYFPDHPVMQALSATHKEQFVEQELMIRSQAQLPPYGRMVAFIFKGLKEASVETTAKRFARCFPPSDQYRFLGPIQAPIYRIRGQFRWRALLLSNRDFPLQKMVQKAVEAFVLDPSVRMSIDVDPYSFL